MDKAAILYGKVFYSSVTSCSRVKSRLNCTRVELGSGTRPLYLSQAFSDRFFCSINKYLNVLAINICPNKPHQEVKLTKSNTKTWLCRKGNSFNHTALTARYTLLFLGMQLNLTGMISSCCSSLEY